MTVPRIGEVRLVTLEDDHPTLAIWRATEANCDFFMRHADELWKRHNGQELLIYDAGTVEAFDDLFQAVARREELEEHQRCAAIIRRQTSEQVWLL